MKIAKATLIGALIKTAPRDTKVEPIINILDPNCGLSASGAHLEENKISLKEYPCFTKIFIPFEAIKNMIAIVNATIAIPQNVA